MSNTNSPAETYRQHNSCFSGISFTLQVADNGYVVCVPPNHSYVTKTFSGVVNLLAQNLGLLKIGQTFELKRDDDEESV